MTPLAQPKPDPLAPCECCTTGAPVLRIVEELRAEVVVARHEGQREGLRIAARHCNQMVDAAKAKACRTRGVRHGEALAQVRALIDLAADLAAWAQTGERP